MSDLAKKKMPFLEKERHFLFKELGKCRNQAAAALKVSPNSA
jgi:hypothetical protein